MKIAVKMGIRLVVSPVFLLVVSIILVANTSSSSSEIDRTSNVHPYYDSSNNKPDPYSPDVNFYSVIGDHEARQRDLAEHSFRVQNNNNDNRLSSYNNHGSYSDWTGDANPYSSQQQHDKRFVDEHQESSYRYPQPESKQYGGSQYGYGSHNNNNRYRPTGSSVQQKQYGGGYAPQKSKGHHKDVDLWDVVKDFFGIKKGIEEDVWDLLMHKGHKDHKGGDESYKPSYHYGEPPAGYHDEGESKIDVFKKVKLLAWAATIILIVLGGSIVLAPLAIGKGRSSPLLAKFLNEKLRTSKEMVQLADHVMQSIQKHQLKLAEQQQPSRDENEAF